MGFLNVNFDKFVGKFLFTLIYVFLFVQIYILSIVEDRSKNKDSSFLGYYKLFSYLFITLSTICHLQSSFTNPGKIDHENNIEYIDFYSTTRSLAVKRAEIFNKGARHLIRPPTEEDEVNSDCEYDDTHYEESPSFTVDKIKEINQQFGYEFSKCTKCNVCRMPGVHHCVTCQGCIYGMDHHCPWLNNCVGQFNRKFFIQYCVYSLIYNLLCAFITIYFMVYKQPLKLVENIKFTALIIFQIVLSICSSFLFIRLLYDQYQAIDEFKNNYDLKKNKMLEVSTTSEVLIEMFGEAPSIWWFIPLRVGGLYSKYKSIKYD